MGGIGKVGKMGKGFGGGRAAPSNGGGVTGEVKMTLANNPVTVIFNIC